MVDTQARTVANGARRRWFEAADRRHGTYGLPVSRRCVRDARVGRSWYLEDLAVRVGVSESVICRLELARREASMSQLLTACAALNRRLSGVLRVAEDDAFP